MDGFGRPRFHVWAPFCSFHNVIWRLLEIFKVQVYPVLVGGFVSEPCGYLNLWIQGDSYPRPLQGIKDITTCFCFFKKLFPHEVSV